MRKFRRFSSVSARILAQVLADMDAGTHPLIVSGRKRFSARLQHSNTTELFHKIPIRVETS